MRGSAAATLTAILVLTSADRAAACGTAGCTMAARPDDGRLAKGRLQVDLSFRYVDQDLRLQEHRTVTVSGNPEPAVIRPRVDYETGRLLPGYHQDWANRGEYVQADVSYGVSNRLTAVASWPMATRRTIDHLYVPGGTAANHDHLGGTISRQDLVTMGAGDARVSLRYAATPRLLVGAAVQLPTGRYRLTDETGGIGDPMIQPGSGSWGLAATAQYGSSFPSLRITWAASVLAQRSLENGLGYRGGDEAYALARLTRPVRGPVSAMLQGKAYHVGRSAFHGTASPSTGSFALTVAPGVRVQAPGRVALYAIVQAPVFQHVNETQLGTHAVFQVGMSRAF